MLVLFCLIMSSERLLKSRERLILCRGNDSLSRENDILATSYWLVWSQFTNGSTLDDRWNDEWMNGRREGPTHGNMTNLVRVHCGVISST